MFSPVKAAARLQIGTSASRATGPVPGLYSAETNTRLVSGAFGRDTIDFLVANKYLSLSSLSQPISRHLKRGGGRPTQSQEPYAVWVKPALSHCQDQEGC